MSGAYSGQWIVVQGWDKFQHYKDRNPPWIMLHTELNSNDDWLGLTPAERGVLVTIWVEFARSRGQLRLELVRTLCKNSARTRQIESLVHAGFIDIVASKPLALARSREKRQRREEESARARAREGAPTPREPKTGVNLPQRYDGPDPDDPLPIAEQLERIRDLANRH